MNARRGQTLPLWTVATLVSLTLMLFVYNFSNTVRYSIRAQNAADSAATAAIGNDAAALNSVQTLLAAFDIQQLRVRDVVSAVPQLLTGGDPNCGSAANLLSSACTSDLVNASTDLTTQLSALGQVGTVLNQFSGTLTDRVSNPATLVGSLLAPNATNGCVVAVLTDCDFKYTTSITYGANGLPTVDEYACKKIPNLGAGFLMLSTANRTFYAIGHTTTTLSPIVIPYTTSSLGSALQSTSTIFPHVTSSNLVGNLAGLNVQSGFYVPTSTTAVSPKALTAVCPA